MTSPPSSTSPAADGAAVSMSRGELAAILGGSVTANGPLDRLHLAPGMVSIHSDLVRPGGAFFALSGGRNGHQWLGDAADNGAAFAVVSEPVENDLPLTVITVASTLDALQALAGWYRQQLTATVIAVVGSVGKTTTKDALVHFLSEASFCFGSPASFNSQIGVPLSVLACPINADHAVFEIGASEPGELDRLVDLVDPDAFALTEIGDRYRENFGPGRSYLDEVCAMLGRRGAACLARSVSVDELPCPGLGMGLGMGVGPDHDGDHQPNRPTLPSCRAERSAVDRFTITCDTVDTAESVAISVPTSASWLARNVALAASVAVRLGHRPRTREYHPTSMALQTWRSPAGVLVMRAACVDEPLAWRRTCLDAVSAAGERGAIFYLLADDANAMSTDALLPLVTIDSPRSRTILGPHGRAMQVLTGLVADGTSGRADGTSGQSAGVETSIYRSTEELGRWLPTRTAPGDVVVLFSSRSQLIEGAAKEVLAAMAPSKLFIDLGAIESNVRAIRRQVNPAAIMAVVKASAYGADAPELTRHLANFGVDSFAVSHIDEGIALRRGGISQNILVLLPTADELAKAAEARLAVCVHTRELADAVVAETTRDCAVHVEVDTGMHRTGLVPDDLVEVVGKLSAAGVEIRGLMSHLAAPGDPALDDFTRRQIATFDRCAADLTAAGLPVPPRHILASGGIIRFPEAANEVVRPGLALLGIAPSEACSFFPLRPALTLVSRLVAVHNINVGDAVGYDCTFVATEPTRVGVVQLGYHDGILRQYGDTGRLIVRGVPCRVLGRISMDSLAIDVTDVPGVGPGDEVLIFGRRDESSQPIEAVAEAMGTIPYEVIARLGSRIQRIFVRH